MLAGNVSVRVIILTTRSSQSATRWPFIRATVSAAPQVTGAIRQAAQSTGISFEYLLTTAKIESNFNPSAQASTSSAYQFIDQTWLGTMKQDGAALGLGRYATRSSVSAMVATWCRIPACVPKSCACAAIRKRERCWPGPSHATTRLWSAANDTDSVPVFGRSENGKQ